MLPLEQARAETWRRAARIARHVRHASIRCQARLRSASTSAGTPLTLNERACGQASHVQHVELHEGPAAGAHLLLVGDKASASDRRTRASSACAARLQDPFGFARKRTPYTQVPRRRRRALGHHLSGAAAGHGRCCGKRCGNHQDCGFTGVNGSAFPSSPHPGACRAPTSTRGRWVSKVKSNRRGGRRRAGRRHRGRAPSHQRTAGTALRSRPRCRGCGPPSNTCC